MAEQLNQFLNKAFDFEEQGYVEEAIQLCEKCIQVFPEYENDIKLEIAKMIYRNGEKNLALSQFLTIYQETENSEIRDLILEAYYGEKEQEYEKNCQENWKRLETYPHFFGNAAPSEIRYYPIYQSQKEILFYDSIEQKFQIIERFKVVMENQNNMVCISNDLLWMEDILLLEKMTRKVDPFMDMENALLLVYHKETWDLLLQIFDLKHLIEFDRIVFYDSKDWLEHSILEEGYRFPKIIGGNLSEEIKDLLKDISNKYKQEFTKYHKEALKYYNLAIEEGERQNNRESLVNVYYSKGAYLTQNNQIEEAKQHIEKGMEYAEYIWGKNDIKVAEGYRRLFQVNFREGDYESAYTYCRKAMDIYKNQSEIYSYEGDMASLYNNMGVLNKKLGDYAAALEMYRKSYDIVKDRMGEQDFLAFYEEILSKNIKSFYDSTVDDERGYEAWFEENFENRSGQ